MKNTAATLVLIFAFVAVAENVRAHCDTLDGPVIQDAKQAFDKKDVTPVLKWIRPADEKQISDAFKKAETNPALRQSFFELLVKVHREAEGAEYTGVKPAGTPSEPGVKEADRALETGSPDALVKFLQARVKEGATERLARVLEAKKHKDHSVEAGRAFVAAYVDFVHYVEGAARPVAKHGHQEHKH